MCSAIYRDVEIGHQKEEGEDAGCTQGKLKVKFSEQSRSRVVSTTGRANKLQHGFDMPISTKYKPYRDHVPYAWSSSGCGARRAHKTQISLFLALFFFFGIAESMSGKDDSPVVVAELSLATSVLSCWEAINETVVTW